MSLKTRNTRWQRRAPRTNGRTEEAERLHPAGAGFTMGDVVHARVDVSHLDHHIEALLQKMTLESTIESRERKYCIKLRSYKSHIFTLLLLPGYLVYAGFCLYLNPSESVFVCILGVFVLYFSINKLTNRKLKHVISNGISKGVKFLKPSKRKGIWMRRVVTVVAVVSVFVFLGFDIRDRWEGWTPLAGLTAFILGSVLFSKNPKKINWTPVVWGILLQFALGMLILRWQPGFRACMWLGDQVTTFLGYTDLGSQFVFGDKYLDHPVVFQILPVVVFFSAVVSVLYYIGAMQAVIKVIALFLQAVLNTTPIESFATAAHIFVGQVESSVALRPFWMRLTESEMHAVMTSGFATVAGTLFGAYVKFGVPAEHVISASFMSAPAALAIAKISIPETQKSQIRSQKEINLPSGQETNLIEALSAGATMAIKLIAYVVVNIIAFVAVLGFLDACLGYLGARVGLPDMSFQLICSYVFMPVAAAMGVRWDEAQTVGALIGKKIVLNEFLAYIDLGAMIQAGTLSDRTGVLATYILCGFGSIAALGINLGSLTSAAPDRRPDFARLSVRSMINGNIACFMTACIAGLLYQGDVAHSPHSVVQNVTVMIPDNVTALFNTTTQVMLTSTV